MELFVMNYMRFRIVLTGLVLCLLAFAASPAKAQGDPNAVFATVNGDEIKSSEFWHRLAWYRVDPNSDMGRLQLPAGFLAINQLITEKLIYQMARDKGASPSDPEIEAELKQKEAANPTLLSDLKGEGRPESDLYEQVKYELAQFKLRTFGVTITDQEIEQHYKDYPVEFTTPRRYKLRVIVVDSDDLAANADKQLAAGTAFSDVAKSLSLDTASAANGGVFGVVGVNQLSSTAAAALAAIKIGQTTGWVTGKTGSVRVKYMLDDITPESLQPLDAELKATIRKRLSVDKGDVKNAVLQDLHKATVSAKVVINQAGFQRIYDQMISDYKKVHPSG